MIKIKCTGDFKHALNFLEKARKMDIRRILTKYGREGVNALAAATPQDTGETASSWDYEIEIGNGTSSITWINTSSSQGIPIVILLQYGHGTRNGGYVSGVDFINPAMKGILNRLADEAWKEVTRT